MRLRRNQKLLLTHMQLRMKKKNRRLWKEEVKMKVMVKTGSSSNLMSQRSNRFNK